MYDCVTFQKMVLHLKGEECCRFGQHDVVVVSRDLVVLCPKMSAMCSCRVLALNLCELQTGTPFYCKGFVILQ